MVYALIALGYTMVYGVLLMINFAHSEIFMAGAFVSLLSYLKLTTIMPAWLAALLVCAAFLVIALIVGLIGYSMALLCLVLDIGRPDRFWHLLPPAGHLNFPDSILAWDVLVLNIYFVVNFVVDVLYAVIDPRLRTHAG